jgi:hypothetical protein
MRWPLFLILLLSLTGCATAPLSHEYLDPITGALVTTVDSPLIMAREHQDVVANARQYATITAVTVNRSGRYEYLLLVRVWSTVDPRLGTDRHPGQNLIWLADDRAIRMTREARAIATPPGIEGHPRVYKTDKETLRFLASAKRLRLILEGDDDPRPFEIWTDGRRALTQVATAGN